MSEAPVCQALTPSLDPDPDILGFIRESGLASFGAAIRFTPLAGGVSSDIWKVEAHGRCFAVKRALPILRVAAQWRADPGRNRREVEYLKWLHEVEPGTGPEILAEDSARCIFAMRWFAPDAYPVWKTELLAGRIDPAFAGRVGERLARMHARSSGDPVLAERFGDLTDFRALRLEAYLAATARKHPDLAAELARLVDSIVEHRLALVHGDVSPKNILVGAGAPVFLDAECATWCDPAFDLAFCLNHLALKSICYAAYAPALVDSFELLTRHYLAGVDWEKPAQFESRTARLLPALLLARVDGHSPVEYLDDSAKEIVRALGRTLITHPCDRLSDFAVEVRHQAKRRHHEQ